MNHKKIEETLKALAARVDAQDEIIAEQTSTIARLNAAVVMAKLRDELDDSPPSPFGRGNIPFSSGGGHCGNINGNVLGVDFAKNFKPGEVVMIDDPIKHDDRRNSLSKAYRTFADSILDKRVTSILTDDTMA